MVHILLDRGLSHLRGECGRNTRIDRGEEDAGRGSPMFLALGLYGAALLLLIRFSNRQNTD